MDRMIGMYNKMLAENTDEGQNKYVLEAVKVHVDRRPVLPGCRQRHPEPGRGAPQPEEHPRLRVHRLVGAGRAGLHQPADLLLQDLDATSSTNGILAVEVPLSRIRNNASASIVSISKDALVVGSFDKFSLPLEPEL